MRCAADARRQCRTAARASSVTARAIDAGARARLPLTVLAKQPRAPERKPVLEESPDTAGRGGRETDPGKPAGKCHRNTPPKRRASREFGAGKGEMVR